MICDRADQVGMKVLQYNHVDRGAGESSHMDIANLSTALFHCRAVRELNIA